METLAQKLALLDGHVARAIAAVTADGGASPALVAVVRELERKYHKAAAGLPAADDRGARELVVEVEQAADSAKAAGAADPGITAATRDAIVLAHDAFCLLKFEHRST
jgi:hypothetical protein